MINELAFITRSSGRGFELELKRVVEKIKAKDPYGVIKIQCFPYDNTIGHSALIVSCDGGEPLVGARV